MEREGEIKRVKGRDEGVERGLGEGDKEGEEGEGNRG